MRATCEDCGKSFSKQTKVEAQQALRMHFARIHGNMRSGGNGADGASPEELEEAKKERRRQYQRERRARVKNARKGQSQDGFSVHFCPNCGLPIHLAKLAMAAAAKLQG